jgi:hypothetical protein
MSILNEILDEGTVVFAVPLASGEYAPLKLTLRARAVAISIARCLIEAAVPAGATIEVWVLKYNGDPNNDADYTLSIAPISGATLMSATSVYARAVQFRAKSGGTQGNVTAHMLAV